MDYARIDPELSRELFIRHALVEGDWRSDHRFLAANRALLEDVEELEHRARRRGLVVGDDRLRAYRADHLAGGLKRGHRGARPQQHADLDALGQTSEDVTHSGWVTVSGQCKTGGEMPAGDVNL